jgi:hypothetical protein
MPFLERDSFELIYREALFPVARIAVTGTFTYDTGFIAELSFCVPSAVKTRSVTYVLVFHSVRDYTSQNRGDRRIY